ncbi:hypothetical protein MesoLj131c_68620 (plasmid) [Mesorhizobium sp. 131-3-5]|uniref:hypothetical protein n=1 Tax=Mesorhizobium sp. 131-3-5 TaxID=2744520 RepID=UPI0018EDC831|nr:hypothetical protein [Mesorhizobium sp. 131-3-5]BCH12604.1 hypothetical protein MesoLj131c_68620 [Mesorhizobium sp. 131-3-5]
MTSTGLSWLQTKARRRHHRQMKLMTGAGEIDGAGAGNAEAVAIRGALGGSR